MMDTFSFSRRHFIKVAAAGLALSQTTEAKMINSRIQGVYVGLQTFSLRDLHYEAIIPAMKQIGLGECELYSPQIEPAAADVPDLAKWRATVSLDYFTDVRKKFNQAGIVIRGYSRRFPGGGRGPQGAGPGPAAAQAAGGGAGQQAPAARPPAVPPVSDEEIDRTFQIAKALGAKTVNCGIQVDLAKRFAPIAAKHKMDVGIATMMNPDVLTEILQISPYFKADIDIGDAAHAGYDAFPFIQANYQNITDIHLKDSKLKGASTPFGEGDAHMKEVLLFLKKQKSQIRAHIDCTYPGTGSSVEEVQKCFDYVKACLA